MEKTSTVSGVVAGKAIEGAIITPEVVQLVARYRGFARKTAESIIGLAKTLTEAKQQLSGVDFAIFCDEVGIAEGDSTYSKLRKIGENAHRFAPYIETLPNAWTSLYELAKLDKDQFARIVPSLSPSSTAKEIADALGQKKIAAKKDEFDLTISFGTMGSSAKKEVYDAVNELKRKFSFVLKERQTFITEMKNMKQQQKKVA